MTPAEAEAIGFDFEFRPREVGPATREVQEWLDECKRIVLAATSVAVIERARHDFIVYGSLTAVVPAPSNPAP